ncbi:MAG: shikimate dehydrogenase [Anaerolineales bacterium]
MKEYHLGLIGYPLSHSLSPIIHQGFLKSCGLAGHYDLFPIQDDQSKEEKLQEIIQRIRSAELDGLNVTIPHKQNVITFLDGVTGDARIVGAVNTIYRKEGKIFGDNTDVSGFLADIERLIALEERGTAVVLGAGGAARAVTLGLIKKGWNVIITARRKEQAQQIVEQLAPLATHDVKWVNIFIQSLLFTELESFISERVNLISLIVNCTPIGMAGYPPIDLIPKTVQLNKNIKVYDLVYNPPETSLLKMARQLGLEGLNGMGMLIEQAARSFEIWTGVTLPRPLRISISPMIEETS